jgi:hypothetical protein
MPSARPHPAVRGGSSASDVNHIDGRRCEAASLANVAALCNHASQFAQTESPVECVRLQTEFVKSSMASMQKQSTDIMRAGKEAAE